MPDPQEQTPDFIPAEPKAKPSGDADFIPATSYKGPMTSTGIAVPQGTESTASAGVKGVKDFATGMAEGAANTVGSTVSGIARGLNKIPVVGKYLAPEEGIRALESRTQQRSIPENTVQQIGKTAEQVGEWMLPSGTEEHIASLLPKAGKVIPMVAKLGTSALESGIRNKTQGGSFITGAEAGAGGRAIGEGISAVAPAIAESALGVTSKLRGHGRNIGESILNETSGVRPATIMKQAGDKLGILTKDMESGVGAATTAGAKATTNSANQIIDDALAKAPRNAPGYREKLESLRNMLDFKQGAGPQQRVFTPDDVLEMKRGIDKEISSWDNASRQSVDPVKRQLYRALDSELDQVAQGNKELNQRISSLIPVQKRTQQIMKNASTTQRIVHRAAAHTGALAGAGIGAGLGYREGGIPGAVAGGIGGAAIPELVVSPTAQMTAARLMRSPMVGRSILGSAFQFDRNSPEEEEQKKRNEEK